jgi:Fur family ferric uptake transcriptional regulator
VSYVTRQKRVVEGVFERASRPLTAQDIHLEARKELPSLGLSTVYRILKQSVMEGQVRLVEVAGVAPHYESAARRHHHFFLCQQCRRLFDLAGCVRGVQALAPNGFRVEQHEIVLFGACAACVRQPEGNATLATLGVRET